MDMPPLRYQFVCESFEQVRDENPKEHRVIVQQPYNAFPLGMKLSVSNRVRRKDNPFSAFGVLHPLDGISARKSHPGTGLIVWNRGSQ